jgi:hypothetical protein
VIPVKTDETNFTYKLPGGTEENDLPCVMREAPDDTTSFWKPEDHENLAGAGWVRVQIWHASPRLVQIGIGDTMDADLQGFPVMPDVDGSYATLLLDDELRAKIRDSHIILRIEGHPTPPVSVTLQ